MCFAYFSDADIVDVSLLEAFDITGVVPGSVGATHVWLLLTIF